MPLVFQSLSFHNNANYRGGKDTLCIFGRDQSGTAIRCEIEGFRPYIFLHMAHDEWCKKWALPLQFLLVFQSLEKKFEDMETLDDMMDVLVRRMRKPPILPTVDQECGFNIKDVGFGDGESFLRLTFFNWSSLQKLKRVMREYNTIVSDVLDHSVVSFMNSRPVTPEDELQNIRPILEFLDAHTSYTFLTFEGCFNAESMFLIHYNVKASSWLSISPVTASNKSGRTFSALYNTELVVKEPSDCPPMANFRMLSYDIEAVPFKNADGTTQFPIPERDPICCIGIACYEYGTQHVQMLALSVGDTPENWSKEEDDPTDDDYDPSEVVVHTFLTESKMLEFFAEFIRTYDADLITGFNILNFDNVYMLKRAAYKCKSQRALWWGRDNKVCRPEKKFSTSKQSGGREYYEVNIVGREFADLYPICKTDHKLRSYKLDDVAQHFLGTSKIEMSYDAIPDLCRTPEGRRKLAVYCTKDAYLPMRMMVKLSKVQNLLSLSYVTGAPVDHILNRGQQIRTLNLIIRHVRTHQPRLYIPDRTEENTEGFQGAVVLDPKPKFYTKPVAVLDFGSLYPSIMIANNMCFSTKISRAVASKHRLVQGEDFLAVRGFTRNGRESFKYIDEPDDTCFLMPNRRQGVLPTILQSVLASRKVYKKKMKSVSEDSVEYGVFNGHQLALKISANSIYGFCGASRGVLTDPAIASAVTKMGRSMTNRAAFVAESQFVDTDTVYGDTDSIFVELGEKICPTIGKTEAEIIKRAEEVGEEMSAAITKCFRKPNILEYEKTFKPFLLKGKKRYAGRKHEPGKRICMDVKGFECVRRDFAPLVSQTQKVVFQKLVGEENTEGAIEYAKEVVRQLVMGEMPLEMVTMCKQLTRPPDQYKSKAVHVELAKELQRTLPETVAPKVGDRIDYCIREGPEKQCFRGVVPADISSGKYKLDLQYYLNKQLRQPYMRIFTMVMPNASSIFEIYDKDEEERKKKAQKLRNAQRNEQRRLDMNTRDIRSFFSNKRRKINPRNPQDST